MNIRVYLRQFGAAALVAGMAVGCAQQQTTEMAEEPCQVSPAAQNAIDAAKAAYEDAKAVAYAWRDTEAMIKEAEGFYLPKNVLVSCCPTFLAFQLSFSHWQIAVFQ